MTITVRNQYNVKDSIAYIIKSASKLVFIMLFFTVCTAFLYEVIAGRASLEASDFMVLVSGAAAFYFSNKPTDSKGEIVK